ncbi:hypothetical protein Q5P01_002714 [Channa striata]|uniref:Uncharacterized protein n=1 Tax=Channa striata TaxID=64152 RepID=A0AA88NN13_CHASR|nr:hypothetical protein Q5P01_002714 [Channa striata]
MELMRTPVEFNTRIWLTLELQLRARQAAVCQQGCWSAKSHSTPLPHPPSSPYSHTLVWCCRRNDCICSSELQQHVP